MATFSALASFYPEFVPDSSPSVQLLLKLAGHYRAEHFNQVVLEDLRQRLSRQGVSLRAFRLECLPFLQRMLDAAALSDGAPDLFDYALSLVYLKDMAPAWLSAMEERTQPATIRRYQNILNDWLLPRFEGYDLLLLDGSALSSYHTFYLEQGGAASSFTFHKSILFGVLDFAVSRAIADHASYTPEPAAAEPVLFRDVAPLWIKQLEHNHKQDYAAYCNEQLLYYLLPWFGLTDLRKLDDRKVGDYRRDLARKGGGSEVFRNHFSIIKGVRRHALNNGLIEWAPHLHPPKDVRPIADHLPDHEKLLRLLCSESGRPDVLVVFLIWALGLRPEEVSNLQWGQLDLTRRVASVSGRSIPIPSDLAAYLAPLSLSAGNEGYVVRSVRQQSPISVSYVRLLVRDALTRFGMKDTRLSDLHHDFAIQILRTHTLQEAADICGYQNISDLLRLYVDFLP